MIMAADNRQRCWCTFGFDPEGRLAERSVRVGLFNDIAREFYDAAGSDGRDGYDLAAAVFCAPHVYPEDLKRVMSDVLSLKMPYGLVRVLPTAHQAAWKNV